MLEEYVLKTNMFSKKKIHHILHHVKGDKIVQQDEKSGCEWCK